MFSKGSSYSSGGLYKRFGANVTREMFNFQASNWASNAATSPAPSFTFGSRRIHDCHCEWVYVETSQGNFTWTTLDAVVNALPAGSKFWFVTGFPAAWASSTPGVSGPYGNGTSGKPADNAYWTSFITALLNRYGANMQFIEGWNEANLTQYFTGTNAEMITLQNLLYTTSKSLFPNLPVLSPSCTGVSSLSMPTNGTYIQTLYDGGALFDGIATHVYINTALSLDLQIRGIYLNILDTVQICKKLNKFGVISEIGQQNWAGLSETDKEKYFKRALMLCLSHGVRFTWYSYDSASTGDITDLSRQQWWIDMYNLMIGKYVEFGTIAADGTVTIYVDGSSFSF